MIWGFCVLSYWYAGHLAETFMIMLGLILLPASALFFLLMGIAWVTAGFLKDRAE